MRIHTLIASAALLIAASTAAFAARDLPVPVDKGWQHADTGLILPATLDGMARDKLADNGTAERDVYADFRSADKATNVTIFLFHPAIDDVAMWFDRAQSVILSRDVYGGVTASGIAPMPFAPPRATTASGLRQAYTPTARAIRGTALAVMPLGEWLVAVRASSTTLDAAATDAAMSRAITAMRWPQGVAEAAAAVPIGSCADALHFGPAKPAATDAGDALMPLLLGAALKNDKARAVGRPVHWCRDAASGARYGIYRGDGAGYEIAFGDAGRVMAVTPTLDTQLGKGNRYSVSFTDVDDSVRAFPAFDGLPSPEQAIALLAGRSSGVATHKDGQTAITLPAK
ncbi:MULTISPECIES: hypothetical protein [unclassified Sphingomonas]|uniref:hypothetical protein n=1 Tax=unclassified Sphingomonas TaxID=196159 RepID=UPI0022698103|nr:MULTISPECIES: hypothetical protein [unclassified Sphingomonas]